MARARTFAELQAEARALTDTVGDDHVSDTQLGVWLNQGIAELWRKLVACDAGRYAIRDTLSTTAGTQGYDVEDDFLAMLRVSRLDGTRRIPIARFNFQQAAYDSPDPRGGDLTRYTIIGQGIEGDASQIYFDPDPGTNTYETWYVQCPQLLSADDDVFDGVAGYEDWVVLYASLRIFIRQQDPDQMGILAEMARIDASIVKSATHRDVGSAPRIADVRQRSGRRY